MTRSRTRLSMLSVGRRSDDAGISMVEMMVSLVVIAIVASASVAFFVGNIRGVNSQRQHQEAVDIANQQLETVQALPVANLVHGRAKADVQNLYTTAAATALNISTIDNTSNASNYDPTATTSTSATVPLTKTTTLNGVAFTATTFIDICWFNSTSGVCGPTQGSTTTSEYRVSIYLGWPGSCAGGCSYTTSTLINPSPDPVFNSNISSPSGTITTPANSVIYNDNAYTSTCTTSAGTSVGTEVIITGATNLTSTIRVLMSSGGGSVADVAEVGASEIDMCVIAGDTPGTYTLTIVNRDGGHFQVSLYEIASLIQSTGWSPSTPSVTLLGGGLETGATLTATTGSSWSGYTVYNCSSSTTGVCASTGGLDAVVVNNFSGPSNGASSTLSVTNPDGSTPIPTYVVTAPTTGTLSRTAVAVNSTQTISVNGATGFLGSPNTLGVAVTAGTGTASIVYASASSATLSVNATAVGTMTLYFYNDDGGKSASFTLTVDPQPTVATATPNFVVAGKTTSVSVTGTGFIPTGFTASASRGTVSVTSVSSTALVLSVNAGGTAAGTDVITLTNADGGTVSFSLAVHAAPVASSASPNPIVVSTTTTVTVSGSGFVSTGFTAAASNGTVSVTSVSATSVVVSVTAATAGTDTLTFTNADGGSTTIALTVDAQPVITGGTPNPVAAGVTTTETVTGTGFIASGFTASASNGTVSVSSVTSTRVILLVTPSSAGTDTVTLRNADGGTTSGVLTVNAAPTVTALTPTAVSKNTTTTWTITGTGFQAGANVNFTYGGAATTEASITVVSSTKITFTTKTPNTAGTFATTTQVVNPDNGTSNTYSVSVRAT